MVSVNDDGPQDAQPDQQLQPEQPAQQDQPEQQNQPEQQDQPAENVMIHPRIVPQPYNQFNQNWPQGDWVEDDAGNEVWDNDAWPGGFNPYLIVYFRCGCGCSAGVLALHENQFAREHPFLAQMPPANAPLGWAPDHDFMVSFSCASCEMQIAPQFSAYSIHQYHGWHQWLAQNA